MASTKQAYDPVHVVESMFNGSVTRIAYALRDPANYAGDTKVVLIECAKRFQDALDDCEIQLLDAKWYLEHRLAQNRSKREAASQEQNLAAKRKLAETEAQTIKEPSPPKKVKLDEDVTDQKVSRTVPDSKSLAPQTPIKTGEATQADKSEEHKTELSAQPQPQPQSQSQSQSQPQSQPQVTTKSQSKGDVADESSAKVQKQPQDDFAQPTPQLSPAATNEDFNIDSMFGDPTADAGDEAGDLGFGIIDDPFDKVDVDAGQDPAALESLLPGLSDYANQTGGDTMANTSARGATGATGATAAAAAATAPAGNFDRPDINAVNDFDAFLNDDTFADGTFDEQDGDKLLGDQAFQDINFDDFDFSGGMT